MNSLLKIVSIVLLSNLALAGSFVDRLESELKKNKVKSLDESLALPILKHQKDDPLALMYFSKSMQQGTIEKPRVIMGKGDNVTLAYGGDNNLRGGDSLEVIEFNHEAARFEFSEISFSNGSAQVERNPSKCLGCHGNDPRPNWESYFLWPGAFMGVEDNYFGMSPLEVPLFEKVKFEGPRYSFAEQIPKLNNQAFNKRFAKNNAVRLARIILAESKFRPYLYLFVANSVCLPPENIEDYEAWAKDYLDPKVDIKTLLPSYDKYRKSLNAYASVRAKEIIRLLGAAPTVGRWMSLFDVEGRPGDYIFEYDALAQSVVLWAADKEGVSTERWSTAFNPNVFSFNDGREMFYNDLVTEIIKASSELKGLPFDSLNIDLTCQQLKDRAATNTQILLND